MEPPIVQLEEKIVGPEGKVGKGIVPVPAVQVCARAFMYEGLSQYTSNRRPVQQVKRSGLQTHSARSLLADGFSRLVGFGQESFLCLVPINSLPSLNTHCPPPVTGAAMANRFSDASFGFATAILYRQSSDGISTVDAFLGFSYWAREGSKRT